ncbi:MAG: hypothetical protein DMF61_16575 [Blastocatellia bacterium AA13]|nr:MAG: hypothetical protein DMF61_16575 [Blastocatellia bacterium AA13]
MARAKAASKSIYGVHPGVAMVMKWIEDLPAKTGKSLEEWIKLIKKQGPKSTEERRDWLKKEYGLGTNSAWWLVDRAEGKNTEDADPDAYLEAAEGYVEEMFTGPKQSLRPIYDRLLKLGLGIGKDVKACPCKTIIPLYRKHVFAQIKPATRTRIDFGFALGGMKGAGRLIETGGFAKKDRITHRIAITSVDEIDDEVKKWLKTAYDLDA